MSSIPSIETKSPPQSDYERINVNGPITVEQVEHPATFNTWKIVVMGPTGAGKSTFIEALGLRGGQPISSNQLDGFTQSISAYRLNNVTDLNNNAIYFLDSPGFVDTRISEMAIVNMLQEWLREHDGQYFNQILYMTPITQVRMPGSHRQVLRTFRALAGVDAASQVTIVTTMWDQVWGESATRRAEATYNQLENKIWKDLIKQGAQIVKFHNNQESAMSIVNQCLDPSRANYFALEEMVNDSGGMRQSPFAANLYNDLQDRVQNLTTERVNLQSELALSETKANTQLQSILFERVAEVEKYLAKFTQELWQFDHPHANDGEPVVPSVAPAPVSPFPSANPALEDSISSPTRPVGPSRIQQPEESEPQLDHQQRERFSGVLKLMSCCGKGVEQHHEY